MKKSSLLQRVIVVCGTFALGLLTSCGGELKNFSCQESDFLTLETLASSHLNQDLTSKRATYELAKELNEKMSATCPAHVLEKCANGLSQAGVSSDDAQSIMGPVNALGVSGRRIVQKMIFHSRIAASDGLAFPGTEPVERVVSVNYQTSLDADMFAQGNACFLKAVAPGQF